MGKSSVLRNPKKEEQEVPETYQGLEILDDLEGFLGINTNDNNFNDEEGEEEEEENDHIMMSCKAEEEMVSCSDWDLTNNLNRWEQELLFPIPTPQSITTRGYDIISNANYSCNISNVKKEEWAAGAGDHSYSGLWNNHELVLDAVEETKASLNLNLNYEQVLEAWSNRGSLWAHHHPSFPLSTNYGGEVPNLEEERTRRKSSVMRYKEKRQNRLFSRKIRYEVRKLNADKRPRLKGRFVKRTPDNKT